MLVVDRGVGARRVRVIGRLLHGIATCRGLGRRRLGEDRCRGRDAARIGLASPRGQEDRDDGDGDGDDDEPQPDRPVPAPTGHRTLDLFALEPGLLAPLGLGRAPPWIALVASCHVDTSRRLSGPQAYRQPAHLRRTDALPMLGPTFPVGSPACCSRRGRWGRAMATTDHDRVIKVEDPQIGGLDRFFKITERGSSVRTEIIAGVGHLADDGLHPVRQPGHPRIGQGQRGDHAHVPGGADRHGPRRGRHDARHGHLRELPVRDRGGTRAERVRHVHARRDAGAHVAAGDGRHRDRGRGHHAPRAHGVPGGGAERHPDGPETRDRDRDRPVPGDHRSGQRRDRRGQRRPR